MIVVPTGFPLNRRMRRLEARGKLMFADEVGGGQRIGGGGESGRIDSLYKAAEENSAEGVDAAIRAGATVNDQSGRRRHNCFPIHTAAENNACRALKALIRHGADINALDRGNNTPLHIAAGGCFIEAVNTLVDLGARADIRNGAQDTPIHVAAYCGNQIVPAIAALMRAKGASANALDGQGRTPIQLAAAKENSGELVSAFAEHGGDVNAQGEYGHPAIWIAVERNNHDAIVALHRLNAAIPGNDLLRVAAKENADMSVEVLHEIGVRADEEEGKSLLVLAIKHWDHRRGEDVILGAIRGLLDCGADVNAREEGRTPLHEAVWRECRSAIPVLIENDADVEARDGGEFTPEELARHHGKSDIAREIRMRAGREPPPEPEQEPGHEPGEEDPWTASPATYERVTRPGQQQFRNSLIRAYGGRCAITGESCNVVLEAAHLPGRDHKQHNRASDGILLRIDLHRLLDAGLMTFTSDGIVQVAADAGPEYRQLHGWAIRFPKRKADCPKI